MALAAVTLPFASSVNVGIEVPLPKEPTFELTVARVSDVAPAELDASPLKAGMRAEANVPLVTYDAAMAMLCADADVTRPLPSSVKVRDYDALPIDPTLGLTVASVVMNDPSGDETSPDT